MSDHFQATLKLRTENGMTTAYFPFEGKLIALGSISAAAIALDNTVLEDFIALITKSFSLLAEDAVGAKAEGYVLIPRSDAAKAIVEKSKPTLPPGSWICQCGAVLKGGNTHMKCPSNGGEDYVRSEIDRP